MAKDRERADLWIPDNPDGSGWAAVDWASVSRGSRYHYRHAASLPDAERARPSFYRVVTRLESERLRPHENTYYVRAHQLAEFLGELVWHGGAEVIWHIEPCATVPPEARLG
jgi:hypothetical protein